MATVSIKCPNCGGGLQFDPAAQNYECEYCLSRFTQEELEQIAPEARSESGTEKPGSIQEGEAIEKEAERK